MNERGGLMSLTPKFGMFLKSPCLPQLFQNIFPITDIATYKLNQLRGQCSENHLKCITRWKGRDGVTITIFFQHTRDGHETGYL